MKKAEEFGEGEHPQGHNGMPLERQCEGAVELIEKIEEAQAEIDANNEEAKRKNKPHRDHIAKLKKECRDDFSIEASALQTYITQRRQNRRMDERIANLEELAREQYDGMAKNGKGKSE